jgi:ribosomal protein L11 methyltransferase
MTLWHRLIIELPTSSDAEIATALLSELGSTGALEESTPGNGVRLTAFFDAHEEPDHLRTRTSEAFAPFAQLRDLPFEIETHDESGWREGWKQHFHPFAIVPGIIVQPSWEPAVLKPGECSITLDPGMAFGTGLHETTRLCAVSLAACILPGKNPAPSLLDVGTGSGILAMLGTKLGCSRVTAVENDPDALSVARDNFAINHMRNVLGTETLAETAGAFDIVIVNILLTTLLELKESLLEKCSIGGKLILSGITQDQEDALFAAYQPECEFTERRRDGEWSCLILKRRKA